MVATEEGNKEREILKGRGGEKGGGMAQGSRNLLSYINFLEVQVP